MVIKKKYHGIKMVVLLLFLLSNFVVFSTTCYAVDYSDFDIPVEFFNALIDYTNSNSNLCRYTDQIFTLTVSSTDLKNFYDTYIKTDLKNYITSIGGDDRNMIVVITYPSSSNKYITFYFCAATNGINNTNLTDFKMGLYLDQYYRMTSITSGSWYAMRINSSGVISNSNIPTPGNNIAWKYESSQLDLSASTLNNGPFFGVNNKPLNSIDFNSNILHVSGYYDINPIPDEPSGDIGTGSGTITNSSGEVTGQIDLSGIENGIIDIKNTISGEGQAIRDTISGETEKVISALTEVPSLSGENISSGDIVAALGFEFESDRYANFWYELTQGLKNAFLDSKRSIDVTFQNNTYTISLDDNFAIIPSWLQLILTPFTTCFLVWKLVKWWKLIIDKISSGNVDSILKDNAEEGISNLF